MNRGWISIGVASVFVAGALLSCSQSNEVAGGELGTTSQAILNGSAVTDAKYAAVGALVYYFPDVGVLDVFCSGTLVAPRAIVTARHCTPSIDFALENGLVPAFALGPDAFNPTAVIPIIDYVTAPPAPGNEKGLLLDGGRDVAVAHLESAPVGVTPAKLGLFKNKKLGETFKIAGFGISQFDGTYGQKFAGPATARAIKGRWYELLFDGDYDAYLEWYFTDSAAAIPSEEEAEEWWDIYRLENKYELLAGGLPGEAMACFGDSGGPLLQGTCARDLTTYGVSFAVEATFSTVCGLGGGYLVFNDKMLDFVKDAL
jgi:trypsin